MTKLKIGLLACLFLLCAVSAACGSLSVPSTTPRPTAGPSSDTARIFFLFPQGFPKVKMPVTEQDRLIGYLKPKSYFMHEVPAGEHLFMMLGPYNADGLSGNFLGGKTYYVRVKSNWASQWEALAPGTDEWNETMDWLADADMLELDPEKADEWNEDNNADNQERLGRLQSGEGKTIQVPATNCE